MLAEGVQVRVANGWKWGQNRLSAYTCTFGKTFAARVRLEKHIFTVCRRETRISNTLDTFMRIASLGTHLHTDLRDFLSGFLIFLLLLPLVTKISLRKVYIQKYHISDPHIWGYVDIWRRQLQSHRRRMCYASVTHVLHFFTYLLCSKSARCNYNCVCSRNCAYLSTL